MKKSRLFLVEDDPGERFLYEKYFDASGYQTKFARTLKEARAVLAADRFDAIILDLKLPDGDSIDLISELKETHPGVPVIIITGITDIATAVKAIKCGAENFLTKPVEMDDFKVILERCLEMGAVRKRDYVQRRLINQDPPFFGECESTAAMIKKAKIASSSDAVVLLLGETGTGKGVLARWIHDNSDRRAQAFIEVNCSSLKGELLPSELFGHARGSFTSAIKDKEGLMELADGGTLFLDEIGDMDIEVQARLLKTIEDKSFRRVGENLVRKSDFRLMCATNRALKSETSDFRKDLYYRICEFPISLLPLRERAEEIPGLTEYFLADSGYAHFPLNLKVSQMLSGYPWPGNTRELKNVLKRALLLAQEEPLTLDHFPDLSEELSKKDSNKLIDAEDAHILQVVQKFKGDKVKASKALGLSVSSLYRRMSNILNANGGGKTRREESVAS